MTLDECIRLAWKQNPSVRNSVIDIKEARADYMAAVGAFLPRAAVNAETGKRFGRSIDPDTNGYTNETFEEGTVGLDMTLSLFEGFSRIHQVRFRKMNKERSEWALKNKQNELAYQVTDAYYKLILERKLLNLALEQSRLSERYLKQTEAFVELGLKSASDLQEVKARREGDIYRYKSRENTCRLALLHLEQLMNFQPGDTLVIQDTIVEANQLPLLSVPSTETLYAQSLEILPVMRMIDLKRKAARKEYAMAGGTFSPSVYARFTVGSNFYNTVFSARQLRDNIGKYVGIGEKKVKNSPNGSDDSEGSDYSILTVYYAVTKTGETYTVGSELTMNTTYQWKNGETAVTVPSTITPETVVIDKNENENAKAKAFTLASATNVPTYTEYDESKYRNGEQYLIHGEDKVTENGVEVPRYILSKMDKSTSGAESTAEDTYTVKYYQLVKKTENSYERTELTCTQQTKLGDYEEPSFTLVTKETTVENKVTTSTPGSGTALTLTTKTAEKTAEKNGAALGNVEYTLTITNTSDGTVSTIVGRTNSSGTDSKTWTAPTAGLPSRPPRPAA